MRRHGEARRPGLNALAGVGALAAAGWVAVLLHPARPWNLPPHRRGAWPGVRTRGAADGRRAGPRAQRGRRRCRIPCRRCSLRTTRATGAWSWWTTARHDGTAAVARLLAARGSTAARGGGRAAARGGGWARSGPWSRPAGAACEDPGGGTGPAAADRRRHPARAGARCARLVAETQATRPRPGEPHGAPALLLARRAAADPALRALLLPPLPPRWANRAGGRVAAAAGGCMLVRRSALEAAGGLAGDPRGPDRRPRPGAGGQALRRAGAPEPQRGCRYQRARLRAPSPTCGGWCAGARSPSCGARGSCWAPPWPGWRCCSWCPSPASWAGWPRSPWVRSAVGAARGGGGRLGAGGGRGPARRAGLRPAARLGPDAAAGRRAVRRDDAGFGPARPPRGRLALVVRDRPGNPGAIAGATAVRRRGRVGPTPSLEEPT